jgi:bifunctional non-homologous end joining protein LigD
MTKIDELSDAVRDKITGAGKPSFSTPMKARLTDERFSRQNWIYERKLDGERCLGVLDKGSATLYSLNKKDLSNTYPEIVEALERQKADGLVVDGEVVAFEGSQSSFARLQNRMKIRDADEARRSKVTVYYYLFDILQVDRSDVTDLPLSERKRLLKEYVTFKDPIRSTAYRRRAGEKYYKQACAKGWEGVIAKNLDASYQHSRSSDWLKFKCVHQQELVIGGYTDPQGSRIAFGALLVGFYAKSDFRYAGKVGTGYDNDTLRELHRKLSRLERKTSPFDDEVKGQKGVHWVRPKLVAEFGFTEWTEDNKLRHPRYLGLRRDKEAKEVHKEKAG